MVLSCTNSNNCRSISEIDSIINNAVFSIYTAQNYFNIDNYQTPVEAEVTLIAPLNLNKDWQIAAICNVEQSTIELFDS